MRLSLNRILLGVTLLCSASVAQAQGELRLQYEGAVGCPSAAEFRRSVLERLRRQGAEWPETTFTVASRSVGDHAVAELKFETAEGESVERAVSGETCEDATEAIALITALAVDAWVEKRLQEQQAATTSGDDDEPVAAPGAQAATAATEPASTPGEPPAVPEQEPPFAVKRAEFGASFTTTTIHGPGSAWGGALFGGLRWISPCPATARVSVGAETTGAFAVTNGTTDLGAARFDWVGGRLQLCPYSLQATQWLVADACSALELGALAPSAVDRISSTGSGAAFWAAVAFSARLQAALTKLLRVELELGAGLPLHNEDYRFLLQCPACPGGVTEVYRAPAIGWIAGVGVALGFE